MNKVSYNLKIIFSSIFARASENLSEAGEFWHKHAICFEEQLNKKCADFIELQDHLHELEIKKNQERKI
jgi:hypothetical protein